VLALDPSSAGAHFNLGEMALEDDDPVAAESHFESAVAINGELPGPRFGLGVAAYQTGDIARAEREFDRVQAMAPAYLELQYHRALIAEARNDPATAEQLYRAELEHNPGHHRSWFNLSQIHAQRGDHAAAVDALRRAVETDTGRAPAHILLARSLLALDDPAGYAEAEAAARRGLELDPPPELRPLAHYVLADIYNRLGRPADAQREAALARQAEAAIGR
jgi:tetratricopeptide (TPR) repeat protein